MIVPKVKNELLGIVIVESGWGSMVPTVVLANMNPTGPAARCGQLNIGDQIISINGISLVGLPLSACQTYIKVGAIYYTIVVFIKYYQTFWDNKVVCPVDYKKPNNSIKLFLLTVEKIHLAGVAP